MNNSLSQYYRNLKRILENRHGFTFSIDTQKGIVNAYSTTRKIKQEWLQQIYDGVDDCVRCGSLPPTCKVTIHVTYFPEVESIDCFITEILDTAIYEIEENELNEIMETVYEDGFELAFEDCELDEIYKR